MSAGRVRNPEQAATLEELLRRNASAVKGMCLAYTRNLHDAEDLVQETLLKATAGIGDLRDPHAARSWLLQIARRLCIDHNSRKRSTQALPANVPAPTQPANPLVEWLLAALARGGM